jgi:hypothetical protein
MAIQMGAVTLVGLLAGIAPLVRVGSFVVGDPRHRRAEIGTGVAMLILNLSAAADVFIPWLRVPVWESGVAFAGVAAYGCWPPGGTRVATASTAGHAGARCSSLTDLVDSLVDPDLKVTWQRTPVRVTGGRFLFD